MVSIIENGKKLRALRGGKSAREVAEAVDISLSSLLMYERGERNPRDDVKIALAKYYGVSISDIFFTESFTNSEVR